MERIGQRPSPTVPQTMIILWEGILLRIVIIGAGKLGYSIAELLSKEQYDIVVVDQNETRLETVKDTLNVLLKYEADIETTMPQVAGFVAKSGRAGMFG